MVRYQSLIMAALFIYQPSFLHASPMENWVITNKVTGFQHNTENGLSKRKGFSRAGLISASNSGPHTLLTYWEEGAHRATVEYNGVKIVDGYSLDDVSRIKSFRFDKVGSTVFIKTTKGPKAIVELFHNGKAQLKWPRLTLVSILEFKAQHVLISRYSKELQTTQFWKYTRDLNGDILPKGQMVGQMKECALLSSKVLKRGIALEVFCSFKNGSDVKFLDFSTGRITEILATSDDEFLAFSFKKSSVSSKKISKHGIPILSISGTNNGRQLYHAVYGSLLKYLGEPMSLASDEGGKQSWSQSYRTRTLAALYHKTNHTVFSTLAHQAMSNTLQQQNINLGINGSHNPSCGWASRIYSKDGKSPLSFMINQAMISTSLIVSCRQLGKSCKAVLRKKITKNASCLVKNYEPSFDRVSGLYRIPYGAPFRFDGIWAPWNWQMMWTGVLEHVGKLTADEDLLFRSQKLITRFLNSWETSPKEQAIWRYWPPLYYDGWQAKDNVSMSRPKQKSKNMENERYEDLNHAGISLLGLSNSISKLSPQKYKAVSATLTNLLKTKGQLPRDMNGDGPISPRWLPGAGWHVFSTRRMKELYARRLPGSVSSDQHLAYALLYDNQERFELKLTLQNCHQGICTELNRWAYDEASDFLANNPLFLLQQR